jgi:hypothetical protein
MPNRTDEDHDTFVGLNLRKIAEDDALLEIGRKAIEDQLVEMRDARMFTIRNNGLVIREADGKESSTIRLGSEVALKIGLEAIAEHLKPKTGTAP